MFRAVRLFLLLLKIEGVDIIFSGIIPPNPSELLLNNRINELFTYAKEHYDYIIVDTAPVGLVTDTFLLKDFADLTIYMTRANYLEKKSLSIVKEIHLNKKLKNITLLLNGVDFGNTYGQSKGYGYGNYIDQSTKKSFFNFFKSN
jgi:tyrosine-protein kinase Etk/Wzc